MLSESLGYGSRCTLGTGHKLGWVSVGMVHVRNDFGVLIESLLISGVFLGYIIVCESPTR